MLLVGRNGKQFAVAEEAFMVELPLGHLKEVRMQPTNLHLGKSHWDKA